MPKDVFVSYSSKDKEIAERICGLLELRGIGCWIAPRDVIPGKPYGEEIIGAIAATAATVLILSDHANVSIHVRNEIERAVSKGKVILPVRIREVQPSKALELFVSSSQWIDAWSPPLEQKVDQVAAAIRVLLGKSEQSTVATALAQEPISLPSGEAIKTSSTSTAGTLASSVPRSVVPKLTKLFFEDLGNVYCVGFSPDGCKAFFISEGGFNVRVGHYPDTIVCWEVEQACVLRRFKIPHGLSAAFSPDGRRALSGGKDQTAHLWDLESGRELRSFVGHTFKVAAVAFYSDGRRAVAADGDATVHLWDLATGDLCGCFEVDTGQILTLAVSPDGRWVLSGADDNTVRLWDPEGGHEVHRFMRHTGPVMQVAFSPCGRRVLSCSYDATVRLWDIEEAREIHCFEGHASRVNAIAFSPDGRKILSGGDDSTVRLWNAEGGCETRRFEWRRSGVRSVTCSSDGRWALSGSFQTVRFWPLPQTTA